MEFTEIASKLEESLSEEVTRMKRDKESRRELLDVLVVSYDCFSGVYAALWKNVEKAMQVRFRESIDESEAAGHTPQQNSVDLIDLYLS